MDDDIVDRLRQDATCTSHHEAANEIAWLRGERNRLAADLSNAHMAILPWIDQVGWLNAQYAKHVEALRRIGMPGKDIGYCRDGHEIAVLIARDALTTTTRSSWKCPINASGCTQNCGGYGCGN